MGATWHEEHFACGGPCKKVNNNRIYTRLKTINYISKITRSSPWSERRSTRGTACPTARTASRPTLPLAVQAAAIRSPRRLWSLWTSNGTVNASGARTAENQLPATRSPSRITYRCAPSARALRNRGEQVWAEEVELSEEVNKQLQQLQNVRWHNLRLLCTTD